LDRIERMGELSGYWKDWRELLVQMSGLAVRVDSRGVLGFLIIVEDQVGVALSCGEWRKGTGYLDMDYFGKRGLFV
jgi:hypothetical protein